MASISGPAALEGCPALLTWMRMIYWTPGIFSSYRSNKGSSFWEIYGVLFFRLHITISSKHDAGTLDIFFSMLQRALAGSHLSIIILRVNCSPLLYYSQTKKGTWPGSAWKNRKRLCQPRAEREPRSTAHVLNFADWFQGSLCYLCSQIVLQALTRKVPSAPNTIEGSLNTSFFSDFSPLDPAVAPNKAVEKRRSRDALVAPSTRGCFRFISLNAIMDDEKRRRSLRLESSSWAKFSATCTSRYGDKW